MIEAATKGAELATRLTAKAELLGKARAEMRKRRDDPRRWRRSGLLWPLFGKER
ncbi:hypothetical protein KK137_12300 [Croceibacterium sp. LX-88]|uniref:Uncharacterized protein n=1 Tax=Croceibacterium selenioxidans TaxID=2838833 RepID=A0ABS5W5T4_9SPHN|nr:hypothetical protein [Croceibacterium selenioxidans]MBT2135111.1 hypothetical protein [Croceibacterium selenioxidans]